MDLPPTFSEMLYAIKSMKDNKSSGPDNIPAELLKYLGYLLKHNLCKFILEVWEKKHVPEQWKDTNVKTIYKIKVSKSICGNNRGISLFSVTGKVLSKTVLRRSTSLVTEDLLPESQWCFCKDRGTVDMIFTARKESKTKICWRLSLTSRMPLILWLVKLSGKLYVSWLPTKICECCKTVPWWHGCQSGDE